MKSFLSSNPKGTGKNGKGFDESYWSEIYGNGLDVDGSYNAKEHANYLHALFRLMDIPVYRIADFGFGKAILLREMVKTFSPVKVYAVDASQNAYEDLKKKDWVKRSDKFHIYHSSLENFILPKLEKTPVELGICNSVIQYLPDSEIPKVLERMAKYCNYLYFTVPTNVDYAEMKKEMSFIDPYAYSRSAKKYRKWLSRDFEIVGYNLLQSKWLGEKGFKEDFFRI
ncbi:class I SAM-dependent methyltransferase [Leptospira sp. 96542]|nr:class I SAM-dependent methyltransferase [Leptospira sp. 96542]